MNMERRESGLLVPKQGLIGKGRYTGKILRKGMVIEEWEDDNLIVNQGLDNILAVMFTGASQSASWYLAPYTGNYTPVATDTAASIVNNATECTAYTASTRVPFTGVESNQNVSNAQAAASFTFNATATIYGAFLTNSSAQGSTSGILFSAAQFSSAKNVVNNDQLLLTYSFGAASA